MGTLFTFETTHHALWAEEVAGGRGIACDLVPAPAAAAARCNLALETHPDDVERTRVALDEAGVPYATYAPR